MSTSVAKHANTEKKSTPVFGLFTVAIALIAIVGTGAKITWPSANAAPSQIWTTQTESPLPRDINVDSLNRAFTTLAERMSPAVVNIYTKAAAPQEQFRRAPPGFGHDGSDFYFGNPFDRFPGVPRGPGSGAPEAQALGSGFVINNDGFIVTNAHVVRMAGHNAAEIMVKFIGEENSKGHAAKIIGTDETTDVALLKLVEKKTELKIAPLGNSDLSKVGEWVVAIGNPYGHTHTLTQGIVSAVGRSLQGARADFIQTSASINPGNSGGPLINLAGEVIGINTAIDPRAQGIGFAIPINIAKNVITQLMQQGKVTRAWMGIAIQDLNPEVAGYMRLSKSDGVLVKQVMPGQPAALAGMAAYDIITRVNGNEIRTTRDLFRSVDKLDVGKTADIEILRNNQSKVLKVEIAEQPVASS